MISVPRPARLADAAELARLSGQLGYPVDAGTMAARLESLLADPRQWVHVMDGGGCLSGWISAERRLSLESGTRIEITGLVVDAAMQRSGVGRVLLTAAENWAIGQCIDTVTVRSNAAREASHAFYLQQGYLRQKTQHVYRKLLPG